MINFVLITGGCLLFGWIISSILRNFIGTNNRQRYFADCFKDFPVVYNALTNDKKTELFKSLDAESTKCKNGLCILEIGAGSGSNFKYYPKNSKLIVVDPNPHFTPHLKKTLENFPDITLLKSVTCDAENMAEIESSSVDVVVSTIVLCSVKDIGKICSEVNRVLAPGGKFLFMEHVLEDSFSFQRFLQIFLGTIGLWPFLCDGCQPHRNIEQKLRKATFSSLQITKFRLDFGKIYGLFVIQPHIYGVATKK